VWRMDKGLDSLVQVEVISGIFLPSEDTIF